MGNIFICLVAPMLIAVFCLKGSRRDHMVFLVFGMTACFLSLYITTYLRVLLQADQITATVEIAPYVEELMKVAPLILYLLLFFPNKEEVPERVLMISVGFATFENVCYLITKGSDNLLHLLIRGFGTGAMHVVCGTIISAVLVWLWGNKWLRVAGTIGVIAVAITYHGVYNILVSQKGYASMIGFMIPLLTTLAVVIIRTFSKKNKKI